MTVGELIKFLQDLPQDCQNYDVAILHPRDNSLMDYYFERDYASGGDVASTRKKNSETNAVKRKAMPKRKHPSKVIKNSNNMISDEHIEEISKVIFNKMLGFDNFYLDTINEMQAYVSSNVNKDFTVFELPKGVIVLN